MYVTDIQAGADSNVADKDKAELKKRKLVQVLQGLS